MTSFFNILEVSGSPGCRNLSCAGPAALADAHASSQGSARQVADEYEEQQRAAAAAAATTSTLIPTAREFMPTGGGSSTTSSNQVLGESLCPARNRTGMTGHDEHDRRRRKSRSGALQDAAKSYPPRREQEREQRAASRSPRREQREEQARSPRREQREEQEREQRAAGARHASRPSREPHGRTLADALRMRKSSTSRHSSELRGPKVARLLLGASSDGQSRA